jgi:hypothetical protein
MFRLLRRRAQRIGRRRSFRSLIRVIGGLLFLCPRSYVDGSMASQKGWGFDLWCEKGNGYHRFCRYRIANIDRCKLPIHAVISSLLIERYPLLCSSLELRLLRASCVFCPAIGRRIILKVVVVRSLESILLDLLLLEAGFGLLLVHISHTNPTPMTGNIVALDFQVNLQT